MKKRALRKEATHVILGVDLYMGAMTEAIEKAAMEDIIMLDYEAEVDVMELGGMYFYSPDAAKRKYKDDKNIIFHKFLCKDVRY